MKGQLPYTTLVRPELNSHTTTLLYTIVPRVSSFKSILVDIGEVGRHSDGGVLSNSSFGQAIGAGTLSIPDASPLPGFCVTLHSQLS